MKRKIYNYLLNWKKEKKGTSAILVNGARRVGKSYVVTEFAKNEYKSFILIDFNKVSNQIKALFDNYLDNLDMFFAYISAYTNTKLYKRESVIIFDEVQLFPRARSAIKYLVQDNRYDYIETGSLVSIKKNVEDIMIPSEEEEILLHPLDFEEFLWALGNETLMPFIKEHFDNLNEMGTVMHRKAMDYFRQYLIVGGMPQAVNEYVSTKDFNSVDKIKKQILTLYRNDIQKYAKGYEAKVSNIFDNIVSQLQKHEKKFKLSALKQGARMRTYETSFFWLSDAMIINIAYNTTEPNIGLALNQEKMTLKCYMADTGLLLSLAFNEKTTITNNLYQKILSDKLEFNSGMIVENIVSQMLIASKYKLYFFSKASVDDKNNRMEIDFLISKNKLTSKHNISLIEVKSGTRYTTSSLNKCKAKYNKFLDVSYVIHSGDLKKEKDIIYLPLYMTPCL